MDAGAFRLLRLAAAAMTAAAEVTEEASVGCRFAGLVREPRWLAAAAAAEAIEGSPWEEEEEEDAEDEELLPGTRGLLLSMVTVFFNLIPVWISESRRFRSGAFLLLLLLLW